MIERYPQTLLSFMQRRTSPARRVVSLLLGTVFFIGIVPTTFFLVGSWLSGAFLFAWPRPLEVAVGVIALPAGLCFAAWATVTQRRIGHGTPAPTAPTQNLVVLGPYRLCRNPIELGAVLYYLGIGTLLGI